MWLRVKAMMDDIRKTLLSKEKYIRTTIYGKIKKELELKIAEITQQIHQGIYVPEDKTIFGEMSEIWLTQYNPTDGLPESLKIK